MFKYKVKVFFTNIFLSMFSWFLLLFPKLLIRIVERKLIEEEKSPPVELALIRKNDTAARIQIEQLKTAFSSKSFHKLLDKYPEYFWVCWKSGLHREKIKEDYRNYRRTARYN